MVTVNVVVLAGTVAAEPVERRMPSGDEVTELRLSVPEAGEAACCRCRSRSGTRRSASGR
jgi:single-stranded DNA-binding protein